MLESIVQGVNTRLLSRWAAEENWCCFEVVCDRRRRPAKYTGVRSSAASDVYKRQVDYVAVVVLTGVRK